MKKPDFQTRASKKKEAFKENIFRHSITWGFILSLMYLARILIEIKNPIAHGSDEFDIATYINDGIAMFICSILLTVINYNVRHKRVFVQTNANLIKSIGYVLLISGCTPLFLYFLLFDANNYVSRLTTINYYLFFIGIFVIEIGYILQKAVKMKEEQDLTI